MTDTNNKHDITKVEINDKLLKKILADSKKNNQEKERHMINVVYAATLGFYKDIIKSNCKKCHGTGIQYFLSNPGVMPFPFLCKCVIKNHKKENKDDCAGKQDQEIQLELLDKLLNGVDFGEINP